MDSIKIPHTVYHVHCKECCMDLYVTDNECCPVCGQDDFKELSQREVYLSINQYTGEVEADYEREPNIV